ncbi:MAG: ATP-binding protein [Magnetococcales bacterium]|nr:ATP-binding protein [Magnetococcales bacterium]
MPQTELTLQNSGRAEFQNLTDARQLAQQLARLAPDFERTVSGLQELMINAVEHGNLEISYADKNRLIQENRLEQEIDHRLSLDEFSNKVAVITWEKRDDIIVFTVKDQGKGFDWKLYLEVDMERVEHAHGRGIAMSRLVCFDQLNFNECGNEVTATVLLKAGAN